ncbi:hypothetical protein GCM10023196_071020 [Actinoallomurus vinaceus]|uniref:Uncharacterized protein n=1 Tax=Actinoallomurus vinaceus TaxID=1080074 RepID=A0ABP8UJW7_9ACTN
MADDRSREDLEEELRLVEEDIASIRPQLEEMRRRIGERDDDPTDPAERAAMIENADEQEALLDRLEERRAVLLRRLGRE